MVPIGDYRLLNVTTGYYRFKQFSASYALIIYRGCSFKEYLVLVASHDITKLIFQIVTFEDNNSPVAILVTMDLFDGQYQISP